MRDGQTRADSRKVAHLSVRDGETLVAVADGPNERRAERFVQGFDASDG